MFKLLNQHRFLLEELIRRDFDRKYKGSLFGAAWSILNPLFTLLIMRPFEAHLRLFYFLKIDHTMSGD